MFLTSKTVDATIDVHQRISEAYCALTERIERRCSKIDVLNQIDVRRNGHSVTIRAADGGDTAILGWRGPLNRPNCRRIKLLVRAQSERSHFGGSADA